MATAAATQLPPLCRTLETAADRYRLRLPERRRMAPAGEWLGKGAGSSIEYQDRKDYTPGDDVRRIDWRAYARNDRLSIKLYREEIRPTLDVICDASASMAVGAAKREMAIAIAWFFYLLGQELHADARAWRLGARLERVPDPLHLLPAGEEASEDPVPLLLGSPVPRRGGLALFVSDFLFPVAPEALAGALARAERAVCVQVLTDFEADPPVGGHVRLEDAESGAWRDVALDGPTVAAYKRRLTAWREALHARLRRQGGELVTVRESDTAETLLARLTRAGVIEA